MESENATVDCQANNDNLSNKEESSQQSIHSVVDSDADFYSVADASFHTSCSTTSIRSPPTTPKLVTQQPPKATSNKLIVSNRSNSASKIPTKAAVSPRELKSTRGTANSAHSRLIQPKAQTTMRAQSDSLTGGQTKARAQSAIKSVPPSMKVLNDNRSSDKYVESNQSPLTGAATVPRMYLMDFDKQEDLAYNTALQQHYDTMPQVRRKNSGNTVLSKSLPTSPRGSISSRQQSRPVASGSLTPTSLGAGKNNNVDSKPYRKVQKASDDAKSSRSETQGRQASFSRKQSTAAPSSHIASKEGNRLVHNTDKYSQKRGSSMQSTKSAVQQSFSLGAGAKRHDTAMARFKSYKTSPQTGSTNRQLGSQYSIDRQTGPSEVLKAAYNLRRLTALESQKQISSAESNTSTTQESSQQGVSEQPMVAKPEEETQQRKDNGSVLGAAQQYGQQSQHQVQATQDREPDKHLKQKDVFDGKAFDCCKTSTQQKSSELEVDSNIRTNQCFEYNNGQTQVASESDNKISKEENQVANEGQAQFSKAQTVVNPAYDQDSTADDSASPQLKRISSQIQDKQYNISQSDICLASNEQYDDLQHVILDETTPELEEEIVEANLIGTPINQPKSHLRHLEFCNMQSYQHLEELASACAEVQQQVATPFTIKPQQHTALNSASAQLTEDEQVKVKESLDQNVSEFTSTSQQDVPKLENLGDGQVHADSNLLTAAQRTQRKRRWSLCDGYLQIQIARRSENSSHNTRQSMSQAVNKQPAQNSDEQVFTMGDLLDGEGAVVQQLSWLLETLYSQLVWAHSNRQIAVQKAKSIDIDNQALNQQMCNLEIVMQQQQQEISLLSSHLEALHMQKSYRDAQVADLDSAQRTMKIEFEEKLVTNYAKDKLFQSVAQQVDLLQGSTGKVDLTRRLSRNRSSKNRSLKQSRSKVSNRSLSIKSRSSQSDERESRHTGSDGQLQSKATNQEIQQQRNDYAFDTGSPELNKLSPILSGVQWT